METSSFRQTFLSYDFVVLENNMITIRCILVNVKSTCNRKSTCKCVLEIPIEEPK